MRLALGCRVLRLVGVHIVTFVTLVGCGEADGGGAIGAQLPIVETAAGFKVSLTAVVVTSEETLVTLQILDEHTSESPDAARFDGLVPKLDLELTGLPFSEDEHVGNMRPIRDEASTNQPKPIIGMEMEVMLGPPDETSAPVTVVLKQLRLTSEVVGGREELVKGPWTFTFTPAVAAAESPVLTVVNQSATLDGVTFVVEQVESTQSASVVSYRIDSERSGRMEETELVARFPDGSLVTPTRIDHLDDTYVAHFDALLFGTAVEFIVPAVLAEVQEEVSITIPIHVSDTGVTPTNVPEIRVENDVLQVTEITPLEQAEQQGPGFTIRVENANDGNTGRVVLRMPGGSATLVDNLGNAYEPASGGTNLEKSSLVDMWAGGSSFGFFGEVPVEATSLTLTTESYALVLGPWVVSVQLP